MVTFAIASLVVVAIVLLILVDWLTYSDAPPTLLVTTNGQVRQVDQHYYVPFTVTNTGGSTAEAVQVMGELTLGNTTETGEQQIDYLSGGEQEDGAFIFSRNPREGTLSLRVASYKLP